jgi:hypothetical protein
MNRMVICDVVDTLDQLLDEGSSDFEALTVAVDKQDQGISS